MGQDKWYSKLYWDNFLGLPQESILGSILYNLFFDYFFYFIVLPTAHNFSDGPCLPLVLQKLF